LISSGTKANFCLLFFTDLDGTLLDHETYSFEPALPAVQALKEENIPLIICTSKTRAEIEVTRKQLNNTHPFISENGGAIFIPRGYFPFSFSFDKQDSRYLIIELGTAYEKIREALSRIKASISGKVKGFGDLSPQEVADLCGLSIPQAELARKRGYDEPFILEDESAEEIIEKAAHSYNLQLTKGGRFYHLLGDNDKGKAVLKLKQLYEKKNSPAETVGLGDSQNDLPLLKVVDHPILIAKADGSYDSSVELDNLIYAKGAGPKGWNDAVLRLLDKFTKNPKTNNKGGLNG
jgi:mannosyl-3-phosphoglycerate phosphatase